MELREGDFEAFFNAPFELYGETTPYVSPMKSDLRRFYTAGVNPLFASASDFALFTVHRDGKIMGRIGAHVHAASNALYQTNTATSPISTAPMTPKPPQPCSMPPKTGPASAVSIPLPAIST